jgi:soluble lytic murein transglycosylase-like protein
MAIVAAATRENLDPALVAAVVFTESSGDQYAQRVERGFWARYAAGIVRWVRSTAHTADDRWARYPDVYASSYGLMQVMLQTAAEAGFQYRYPGELFDPSRNLAIGCAILARHLRATGGDVRQSLLRYNGGGDALYPDRVLGRRASIQAQWDRSVV